MDHKEGKEDCACATCLTKTKCEEDRIVFDSLELLALYTTMTVKRFVKSSTSIRDHLPHLIDVIEQNLARLKIEKKWFFSTIRDQARLYHNEWTFSKNGINEGLICYNTYLLIVAIILGMEKLWNPDECLPFHDEIIIEELNYFYGSAKPALGLKQLSQIDPLYGYLSQHSPNLEILHLPRSDISSFQNCVKFRNLRVIELAGGVSDKVICGAFWNVGKKSDKVLEMAIKESSKDPVNWQLALPHLEVLRNNMLETKAHSSAMRIALGAAALAIQPEMKTVETLGSWNTYNAVLYLLDAEAKQRNSVVSVQSVAVTCLTLKCGEWLNIKELKRVVKACPKLSGLTLNDTENIHPDLSLMCAVIPMKQVTKLNLDVSLLTNLELTVLLAEMCNLEHLTLRLTLQTFQNFNVPVEEGARLSMVPAVTTLVIQFLSDDPYTPELSSLNHECDAGDIMSFLATFSSVKEISFYMTIFVTPPVLVYGCLGGSLAVLHELKHLSVISIPEDLPRELTLDAYKHYNGVRHMLSDLQNKPRPSCLQVLESLVIDELYLAPNVDIMIEDLRLAGVKVSVLYRPGVHRYPRRSAFFKVHQAKPQKIK